MLGFGKKEVKKVNCCCGGSFSVEEMEKAAREKAEGGIRVLGGGCAKCHDLQSNTEAALKELGLKIPVELITDYSVIASYGVMSTPALVINDMVVSYGKVLKTAEIKTILMAKLC